jgi:hypothetical protein
MNIKDIPQDNISTLNGLRKASYGTDNEGKYHTAPTSGWHIEETALLHVINDYAEQAQTALEKVRNGIDSPISYFMLIRYMDHTTLAQAMGLPVWKVKRHCKVSVFKKLRDDLLSEYAKILRIEKNQLVNFNGKNNG